MSYEEFTSTMQILKHAKNHLRAQRGTGNCAQAIVRNQSINLLNDAEFALVGEYARFTRAELSTIKEESLLNN